MNGTTATGTPTPLFLYRVSFGGLETTGRHRVMMAVLWQNVPILHLGVVSEASSLVHCPLACQCKTGATISKVGRAAIAGLVS